MQEVPIWEKEIVTPNELAQLIPEGHQYIRELCKKGIIPSKKTQRGYSIDRKRALEILKAECTCEPKGEVTKRKRRRILR